MFDIDDFLDSAFDAAEGRDDTADLAAEEYMKVSRTSLPAYMASASARAATRRAPRRQASAHR
jgi:hypothetical protein